ncbi:MAG: TetR/AcrR family transcriptional regulator [Myxococcota bacterium]
MARPRSFDPDHALGAALEVFWTRGYADTSIADIVVATGVNRHSLYATWGDKDGLYRAALRRYRAVTLSSFLNPLADAGLEGVRNHIFAIAEFVKGMAKHRGCFAINSAVAGPDCDAELKHHFASIETAYRNALRRAVQAGELPASTDIGAHACHLTISTQAILLQARTGASNETIDCFVQMTLRSLSDPGLLHVATENEES